MGYRKRLWIFLHDCYELGKCDLEVGNECDDFLGAFWSKIL